MKTLLLLLPLFSSLLFASFKGTVIDAHTLHPVKFASISDAKNSVKSDENGSFYLQSNEKKYHIKAYGYRPYAFTADTNTSILKLEPIKVKALYLSFWGASNNSGTLKKILKLIEMTEANAVVVDVKNAYGSTQFWTGFKQANSYGAYKQRTNRDIKKFMKMMKARHIYTIARIVTFKDELQASHNTDYAIKRDVNNSIWRNHD
ncbi:putative glycoside hydrolase, partial [Sulfurimonas sp.]